MKDKEYKTVKVNNRKFKIASHIEEKAAIEIFKIVVAELMELYGDEISESVLHIVRDIALLENSKQQLIADIKERGVVELFKNGSQEMMRDNKSVDKVMKIVEQQRKQLSELQLTPASRKAITKNLKSKVDEFEAF